MEQAVLHPLPPDVLTEPETIELHPTGVAQGNASDPPTTPTPMTQITPGSTT
jgi:hypothetical protein